MAFYDAYDIDERDLDFDYEDDYYDEDDDDDYDDDEMGVCD